MWTEKRICFLENTNYENMKMFFETRARDVIFYGGAGAGKTYAVADKFALEVIRQDMQQDIPLKILVVRKTLPSLKRTCIPVIASRFAMFQVPYSLKKTDYIADVGRHSEICYLSMNTETDYEKVKSITDVDFIWIEEANELTRQAYDILKLRLRGGRGYYAQRILTFNPISKVNWIYDYHFVNDYDHSRKIKVSVKENRFADNDYAKELENLQYQNEQLYRVYFLGEWGQLRDSIYNSYDFVQSEPEYYDDCCYGLDFGFSVNPAALLQIFRRGDEYWIKEVFYSTGLTNADIVELLSSLNVSKNTEIFADSSEPKSIEHIYRSGYNIKPAKKGADSVKAGIDFLMSKKLHIVQGSTNLIKEIQNYSWKKDKEGNSIAEPVKFMDHAMDAMRYAIYRDDVPKGFRMKLGQSGGRAAY